MDSEINNIIENTLTQENATMSNGEKNNSFNKDNKAKNDKVQQAKQEIIPKSNLSENSSETLPIEKRPEFNLLSDNETEKVHFYNSILTAEDCFLISEKLKLNNSCKLLSLGNSSVTDDGLKSICEAIKLNNSLTTIGLGNNKISDTGLIYLGEALQSNKSITTIGLGNNSIGDDGIKFLCEGLKHNKNYQDLLLYNNKLTFKSCEYLSDLLQLDRIDNKASGNKQIKKLYLGSNKIKNEGISLLAKAFKINETLEYLGLSHCEIEDEGIFNFAENLSLNKNSKLKYLALGNNKITSSSVKFLFAALSKTKKIEEVSLEWNDLDDECADEVIEFIKNSNKNCLKKLMLNNNKFTDAGIYKIAEFIVKCFICNEEENEFTPDKLELLVLSNNSISEKVKMEISKMLFESKCTKLKIK